MTVSILIASCKIMSIKVVYKCYFLYGGGGGSIVVTYVYIINIVKTRFYIGIFGNLVGVYCDVLSR